MELLTESDLGRERPRLVRLCARLAGDREAAEDLAQETLLEAWRHRDRLHDPTGADRWLSAIARNVCLRNARRCGRDRAFVALEDEAAAGHVELDLERAELAELLDRALALLPPATRDVLVQRYVEDSPHAEIAARLGVSQDAVAMRLSRGKLVLRRLLADELGDGPADEWQGTRVWCPSCGERRLLVRRNVAAIAFRCPGCNPQPDSLASEFPLGNPLFERLLGSLARPTAILARAAAWSHRYFAGGTDGAVDCTGCGQPVRLRRDARGGRSELRGACSACGTTVSSSLAGITLSLPEVRQLRREHPRVRVLREREAACGGHPALLVRCESVLGSAGVDVLFARETLRLLELHA